MVNFTALHSSSNNDHLNASAIENETLVYNISTINSDNEQCKIKETNSTHLVNLSQGRSKYSSLMFISF